MLWVADSIDNDTCLQEMFVVADGELCVFTAGKWLLLEEKGVCPLWGGGGGGRREAETEQ